MTHEIQACRCSAATIQLASTSTWRAPKFATFCRACGARALEGQAPCACRRETITVDACPECGAATREEMERLLVRGAVERVGVAYHYRYRVKPRKAGRLMWSPRYGYRWVHD